MSDILVQTRPNRKIGLFNKRSLKFVKKSVPSEESMGCFRKCFIKFKSNNTNSKANSSIEEITSCNLPKCPPKSLPLTRRINSLSFVTNIKDDTNYSTISSDYLSENPPELPLRLSQPQVNSHNFPIHSHNWIPRKDIICEHYRKNIDEIRRVAWYWGPLSSNDAELILSNKKNGTFIVRDSEQGSLLLSISYRSQNNVYHTRVQYNDGKFGFMPIKEYTESESIVNLIEKLMSESRSGKTRYFMTITPTTTTVPASANSVASSANASILSPQNLLYPLSRNQLHVPSLQHLSRLTIRLNIPHNQQDCSCLPIPNKLKLYLKQPQYFVEHIQPFFQLL